MVGKPDDLYFKGHCDGFRMSSDDSSCIYRIESDYEYVKPELIDPNLRWYGDKIVDNSTVKIGMIICQEINKMRAICESRKGVCQGTIGTCQCKNLCNYINTITKFYPRKDRIEQIIEDYGWWK